MYLFQFSTAVSDECEEVAAVRDMDVNKVSPSNINIFNYIIASKFVYIFIYI